MKTLTTTLLLIGAASVHAGSFLGLGDIPGGIFESAAYGVSADGSAVVGFSRSASGGEAFRWTSAGGMVGLGDLPGGSFDSFAGGISANGSTIVGTGNSASGNEAFRWTSATGMVGLGDLAGGSFESQAYAISSDGKTIVGSGVSASGQQATLWSAGGPATAISGAGALAYGVSANGQVIVGTAQNQAFRWTAATGVVGIGYLPSGYPSSNAYAISGDGTTIVGQGFRIGAGTPSEAFRWTSATGMVGLGDLPGGTFYSYAWGVSGDGSVIVGTGKSVIGDEAFLWDTTHGMRNLRDLLISDYGVTNLTGWTLSAARAISEDGSTIVGDGINPFGQTEAWIVTGVPEPSAAFAVFLLCGAAFTMRRRSLRRVS
jgi:probable HAF family extracellular repeat protein